MRPVLRFTDPDAGRVVVVELTASEIRDLATDATKLMDADEEQVSAWWRALTAPTRTEVAS